MTAPITFAEHFLSGIVTEFLESHPEVRVTLDLTDRYVDLVGEGYDLALRAGARTGWAVRKDSPKLRAEIADFFQNWALKNGVADYRMSSYMKRVKELKDPTGNAEWKRFSETLALYDRLLRR